MISYSSFGLSFKIDGFKVPRIECHAPKGDFAISIYLLLVYSYYYNISISMDNSALLLVSFRGQIYPMTKEQYTDFVQDVRDGNLD